MSETEFRDFGEHDRKAVEALLAETGKTALDRRRARFERTIELNRQARTESIGRVIAWLVIALWILYFATHIIVAIVKAVL